jgi:hypothetical protein
MAKILKSKSATSKAPATRAAARLATVHRKTAETDIALTLAIGVLVSMFTAITVSRTFLRLVATTGASRDLRWWGVGEAPPTVPAGVAGGERNA